jgi:TRAP-type mannitol/chloroaromatic compound transport system substrate-binding protein
LVWGIEASLVFGDAHPSIRRQTYPVLSLSEGLGERFAELNETNPAWKKTYADYANFLRGQNLWFRFTEMRFDKSMRGATL